MGKGGFAFKNINYLTDGHLELVLEKKVLEDKERFNLPAYYFYIRQKEVPEVIGKLELRIGHNEYSFYAGNIGYEIYPPYRGHHYAAKACVIAADIARAHGMDCLYISCLPDNLPSNKVCRKLGTRLLGTYPIPFHHEMFLLGISEMNIYEWKLSLP